MVFFSLSHSVMLLFENATPTGVYLENTVLEFPEGHALHFTQLNCHHVIESRFLSNVLLCILWP